MKLFGREKNGASEKRAFFGIGSIFGEAPGGTLRDRAGIRRFYRRYTAAFAVIAFCAFSAYIFSGKSLIWTEDAWSQHYKAFVYYAQYLRSIVRTLFSEGRLVIPEWDFAFGEGGDILTTLHYYVIGDPLTVLSVFVPTRYLHILFDLLTILRMYIAGILFSYYCILMGQKNDHAVAIGALVYSFSHWAILNAGRHPYFLNPMVYFPLILIGIEFVIRHRRPYLLTFAVAIASLSNFYFFYMLALLAAFSVFARVFYIVRGGLSDIKGAIAIVFRVAFWSALGVVLSAVILVPVTMYFLQESRAGVDYAVGALYPLSYYTKLPGIIAGEGGAGAMTGEFWLCAGFPVVTLPCIIILFRGKSHKFTKFLLIVAAVAICIPAFGYALNGFSYVTNRWVWALAFLAAFVVTMMWHRLATLKRKDYICIFTVECTLLILCLVLEGSRTLGAILSVVLCFVMLLVIRPGRPKMTPRTRERVMAWFTCVSMVLNSLSFTSIWGLNYAADHVDINGLADKLYDNDTTYVKKEAAKEGVTDFYRYSGFELTANAGILAGLSSTQYYWSLSNPNIIERNSELALRDYLFNAYSGHDGRIVMNTLSSVRYFVSARGSSAPVPYGYKMFFPDSVSDYDYVVYENENALPLGYTYDAVIDKDLWETLAPWEKEDAMLYGAYLDGADPFPGISRDEIVSESVPYKVRCGDEGITYEDGKFTVTKEGSYAVLEFDRRGNIELGVSFTDFSFRGTPEYDLYFGGDDVDPLGLYGKGEWGELSLWQRIMKCNDRIFWNQPTGVTLKMRCGAIDNSMKWFDRYYQFYNGRDDFIINLGYRFSGITTVTIYFPCAGIYSFGSMDVLCRPMNNYKDSVAALKEDVLEDVEIGVDKVTGKISLDKQKLLVMTVPYSSGWSAYVDGEKAELLRANICYMGLVLGPGEHTVELRYRTPYKTLGLCVTGAGVAAFLVSAAVFELRLRKKRKAEAVSVGNGGDAEDGGKKD